MTYRRILFDRKFHLKKSLARDEEADLVNADDQFLRGFFPPRPGCAAGVSTFPTEVSFVVAPELKVAA